MFAFGTSVGVYFATFASLKYGRVFILNFMLWVVFLVWQLAPVLLEGFSPGLNFREIARYPISFRLYFFLNSAYGLLDPAALVSLLWLFAIWAGIVAARPQWALPAALLFLAFVIFNILCNRLIVTIFDRFQSSRKGRERLVVVFLLLMLLPQAIQFINLEKLARSVYLGPVARVLAPVNHMSPPGAVFESLASSGMERLLALLVLLSYCLLVLTLMLWQSRGIYQGEMQAEGAARRRERLQVAPGWSFPGFDPTMAAIFEKEILYLRQNLRMVVQLAYPAIIFLFLFFAKGGGGHSPLPRMMAGAGGIGLLGVFTSLSLLGMGNVAYNIFGMDHEGFGRWLLCPQPLRKIMMAKNLSNAIIFVSLYLVFSAVLAFAAGLTMLPFLNITVAAAAVLCTQFAAGNLFSAYWPKRVDPTQMNSRMTSNAAGFASLLIIAPVGIIGTAVTLASAYWHLAWLPLAVGLVALAIAIKLYFVFLNVSTSYIYEHLEEMESALTKQS